MASVAVPFNDLRPRFAADPAGYRAAVERVFAGARYVLGPEVEAFEAEFAESLGIAHAVGVANGTDAIELALRAAGIGAGDEVITVAHTAVATACGIERSGARPVFVDIRRDDYCIDPRTIPAAVTPRTRAVVAVHLYGQPARMDPLERLAERHGLALVEDCCQAHLATCAGKPVGSFGAAAAYSFYPTKNLGALGDGGALTTNDGALAERARRLRNGGQTDRYHHVEFGVNSRLDEMQAAVLRARLPFLRGWTDRRRQLAREYRQRLRRLGTVAVPPEQDAGHVYHLFPVLSSGRDAMQAHLRSKGIETLIHYPVPIPRQPALAAENPAECPVASRVCREVLSLPLYPALDEHAISAVTEALATGPAAVVDRAHAAER